VPSNEASARAWVSRTKPNRRKAKVMAPRPTGCFPHQAWYLAGPERPSGPTVHVLHAVGQAPWVGSLAPLLL
jgi:hypothetical protein